MQNVPGVDFFIDGHSHTVMTASKENKMIQSTGTGLAYVGAIIIDDASKSIESNGSTQKLTRQRVDVGRGKVQRKTVMVTQLLRINGVYLRMQ